MTTGVEIHIEHFAALPSTNDTAKALAENGAPEGTVVWAEHQTAGRGRFRRNWESPARKGLWFSLVLRPPVEAKQISLINIFTAVYLRNFIAGLLQNIPDGQNKRVRLKWPNDILIGSKKVCGILLETSSRFGKPEFLIVGVGLNVLQVKSDFGEEIRSRATSLKVESGKEFRLPVLLNELVKGYFSAYRQAVAAGFASTIREYEKHLLFLHREITVHTRDGRISGRLLGVDESGFLRLKTPTGEVKITTGDVEHNSGAGK